jgi:hypothetical protein
MEVDDAVDLRVRQILEPAVAQETRIVDADIDLAKSIERAPHDGFTPARVETLS